jgi:hypothetical protein
MPAEDPDALPEAITFFLRILPSAHSFDGASARVVHLV